MGKDKPNNKESLAANFDELLDKRGFEIFMIAIRILTFVGIFILIYVMVTEIQAVKMLAYDSCKICMQKTGHTCIKIFP